MCDDLNLLLSNLNVFYRKLQNYHWNITGKDFFTAHEKLEEYYNEINEQIDEIAEHIISKDCRVMATMKEYLETAQIKEAESKKIRSEEVWKDVLQGYETLIENCKKILDIFAGLSYVGIDYMSKDITTNQTADMYNIVEVNTVPGIHMHMRPSEGKPRNVAKYMVDMIFPETKEQRNEQL